MLSWIFPWLRAFRKVLKQTQCLEYGKRRKPEGQCEPKAVRIDICNKSFEERKSRNEVFEHIEGLRMPSSSQTI